MKKLAHSLPLQDMIRNVIARSTEKLAADEVASDQKVKKLLTYERKEHGHIPTEEEEEAEKKASDNSNDAFVEKLASACDFIAQNIDAIEYPLRGTLMKAAAEAVGAGRGPGALETSKAIGGQQSYKKDKSKTHDPSVSEAKSPLSTAGRVGGKTQLDNNLHDSPGGGSLAPTGKYPADGVLHAGPSVKHAGVRDFYIDALQKDAGVFSAIGGAAKRAGGAIGGMATGARNAVGKALGTEGHLNRAMTSNSAVNRSMQARAPAPASQPMTGSTQANFGNPQPSNWGTKFASDAIRKRILSKLAGEDVLKASISGGGKVSPLGGKGQLTTTQAGQASPHQAGDHNNTYGNPARKFIASNRAVVDATKGELKRPVKAQLKELITEPALSKKTDSVLERNLRNTGKAGVKIAAAKAALTKIAQGGCQCGGNGECSFCQLKSAIREKTANMGGGAPGMGGMGGMMGTKPGGGMGGGARSGMGGGGGMPHMADAGAAADGCTCGGTGECRVCKVKGALASAKADNGNSVEKDSLGDQAPMGGM